MNPNPNRPPVRVGDVVRVGEPDYKYGIGPLLLHVTAIGPTHRAPDGIWFKLRGRQLRPDGERAATEERDVLVRVTAIRVQPPPRKPSP